MNKIIKVLLLLTLCLNFMHPSYSAKLPEEIVAQVKSTFPDSSIRFDGLISFVDGTQYLPIIPPEVKDIDNNLEIVQTIPANLTLADKPDLILFNNNFSLLKIIKKPDSLPTLISSNDIPLTVKLGILPQDLLVPAGLVIPAELRIVLGDLKIPVKENDAFSEDENNNTHKNITSTNVLYPEFTNKLFYVINHEDNKVYLIDPQVGRPCKEIEVASIPSDINLSSDKKYVLVSEMGSKNVSVIDVFSNEIAKNINVEKFPSKIITQNINNNFKNISYVSNKLSSSISAISMTNMENNNTYNVKGFPSLIEISEDNKNIFYADSTTNNIYNVDLETYKATPEPKLVVNVKNASKILKKDNSLYILSRSNNELQIVDLVKNALDVSSECVKIKVGSKPVDMMISKDGNKLFVLSADSDDLSIVDLSSNKVISTINLESGGFPSKIIKTRYPNKLLICNSDAYEVLLVDIEKNEIVSRIPISVKAENIVITEGVINAL